MELGPHDSSGAALGAPAGTIKDGTTATFTTDVLEASRTTPVIVDFWAPWCEPCKQFTPLLEKVVSSYNGKVKLVKINSDQDQELAAQLRVQTLPTVYSFKDGRPVDAFTGQQPESVIRQFLDALIGDGGDNPQADIAAALKAAEDALVTGDLQMAAETYAAILREDKENADALAGLAQCYLKSGDVERAKQTISLVGPDGAHAPAVERVMAALALADKAGKSGSTAELETKLAANPADHQNRFDLAVALAAGGDKARALEHLIEIVKRDRNWNEEAARKQLVELFNAWGPKDAATVEGRKQLSSVLFS